MEKSELEVMLALGDFAFFNAGSAVVAASDLATALYERNPKGRGSYKAFQQYLRAYGDWELAIVPLNSMDFYVSGAWPPTTTEALLDALVKKKRYSFESKRRLPNAVKRQLRNMCKLTTGFVVDGNSAYTSPLSLHAAITKDSANLGRLVSSEFAYYTQEMYFGHSDTTIFVHTRGNVFDRVTTIDLLVPSDSKVRDSIKATVKKFDRNRVDSDVLQCELAHAARALDAGDYAFDMGYDRMLYTVQVCSQMSFLHGTEVVIARSSDEKTVIDHVVNCFAEAVHEAVASFPSHKTVVIAPRSEQGYLRKNMRVFVPAAKEGTKD